MATLTPPRPASVRIDHPRRLAAFRRRLAAAKARAALVTNPLDVGYLTGFMGGDSYLLVTPDHCTLISDFRYLEELEHVKHLATIHIRAGSMIAAVAEVVTKRRLRDLALQSEHVSLAEHKALARALTSKVRLTPHAQLVQPLRAVKDSAEIALIRHAARIQEAALLATLPTIRPGQTELEVAAQLEHEMKRRGSSVPSFETIVGARANGSLPHYRPADTTLAKNQPLLIDWGATYRGYKSDMTRTFTLGRWPAKVREIYAIVLDAHQSAAAALRPGTTGFAVDKVARDLIAKHGYAKQFGHGLGHGIGLNVHEDPRLSHMAPPTELTPGMIVTIEPGIYLPGVGGVRLENDYLVTPKGAECLCSLPMDLEWATLRL